MDTVFWVYVLENPAGRFYIGHTSDLSERLVSHNRIDNIQGKYARKNGPWRLVWSESHLGRGAAQMREREIKAWKSNVRIRRQLLSP
jgi:putative endonuclease